jgi:hypothetical protein
VLTRPEDAVVGRPLGATPEAGGVVRRPRCCPQNRPPDPLRVLGECRRASPTPDICPVLCIYELDMSKGVLFSEDEAGSGTVENTHTPNPDVVATFGDCLLYVNADECTSCTRATRTTCARGGDLLGTGRT